MTSAFVFPHRVFASHLLTSAPDPDNTAVTYREHRMFQGTPRFGTRTNGLLATDWEKVFDVGLHSRYLVDAICSWSNIMSYNVEFNSADSWPGSSVNTMAHLYETVAAANHSVSGPKMTRTSGTWGDHVFRGSGYFAWWAATGTGGTITDNSTTELWVQGENLGAATGDCTIYAPKKWQAITRAEYRFMQITIPDVTIPHDYHEINALMIGHMLSLPAKYRHQVLTYHVAEDSVSAGGTLARVSRGVTQRTFSFTAYGMTLAEWRTLTALINSLEDAPVVFIPDTSDAFDFAICHPSLGIGWSPETTSFSLVEVV